ncbi:MAG: ribose 5-phosphate isomerase A [Candidatus Diapherotrites archaeon]|nr:ribose 5-phosphate isomerase A [Candidatus Diapherotrites archaeon]
MELDKRILKAVYKYVKDGQIIAIGTSTLGEMLLQAIVDKIKRQELKAKIMPTSFRFANYLVDNQIEIANINEEEIDLAVEFGNSVDEQFNFIKNESTSFVRDKMIALSAEELIVITDEKNFGKLKRTLPLEVMDFGVRKTLIQLESLGDARLRMDEKGPIRTETDNVIIDLKADEVYSLEDLEIQAKNIPGVIETGLFLRYADRVLILGDKLTVQSRIEKEKEELIYR